MTDKTRLLDTFLTLTGFDSESFGERAIADELKKRLSALGLTVEEDRADELCGQKSENSAGNVYGFLPGNRPGTPILLSSHMDTVKPGIGKRAVVSPDGTITSDGTTVLGADDAGGLSAILEALTVLREDGILHADVEVLFPCAEEIYGRGSEVFDYGKLRAKESYCFDLTGEIGEAVTRAPTILSLNITVEGRGAHAGFNPEDGINALTAAARALVRIPTGRVAEDTTVNFGRIEGGSVTNAVPAKVVLGGEIRSLRHEEALRKSEEITRIFAEEAEALGASAVVESKEMVRAYETPEDSPVVTRFADAAREVGLEPSFGYTFGGADQNHFSKFGLSGIVAASAMHDVHTVHEYTRLDELEQLTALILALIRKA
ncbi:MAG: M20/M25/M40 family metallo-hydrolase [Ruminococcaceae bacterium]|jgi:tripeptide aminopeptidase|nr:M20/M25/M40 family metallo-hydrolase [Oscillospiraceae bacterium]